MEKFWHEWMMIGNWKEEGCLSTIQWTRESPIPSENRLTAIMNQKALTSPGIWTRPTRIECHRSTAWATATTAAVMLTTYTRSPSDDWKIFDLGISKLCCLLTRSVIFRLSSFWMKTQMEWKPRKWKDHPLWGLLPLRRNRFLWVIAMVQIRNQLLAALLSIRRQDVNGLLILVDWPDRTFHYSP